MDLQMVNNYLKTFIITLNALFCTCDFYFPCMLVFHLPKHNFVDSGQAFTLK